MKRRNFSVPELDETLDTLPAGALYQITRRDYERIFGTNGAALGRIRNFAKHHACVISFADDAILFRKKERKPPSATELP